MCGIWASLGVVSTRAAIDIIAHRGPDGTGWRSFETPAGNLNFGHRRLAIIATDDSGLQPLTRADGRYWITYNGEIYNYRELRSELADIGHRFETQTDTEVIIAAYAEWGVGCLNKFNGMFAFCLYDTVSQKILIARDRFGVKPLYLHQLPDGFAVASEIKQFTTLAGFQARANLPRLRDFFFSGMFDHTDETMFGGVTQLRGGEYVEVELARWRPGTPLPVERWYRLIQPDCLSLDIAEAAERFEWLLRDSVKLRLRADVPVGSCLSGGLDSSSIVCLVREAIGENAGARRHSVTCAFDYPGLNELNYAEAVSRKCETISHVVRPVHDDLWRSVDDMIWHQDEPFGSTSIFAQWMVFKEANAAGITVMLDGQGADESLGGYNSAISGALKNLRDEHRYVDIWRELAAVRRRRHLPLEQLIMLGAEAMPPGLALLARAGRRLMSNSRSAPDFLTRNVIEMDSSTYLKSQTPERPSGVSSLGAVLRHQVLYSSVPMLLHFEDRNSMAHSIEARVPFLDYRLVEFAIALGAQHKVKDGETKVLLRQAMRNVLPPLVLHRQDKLGFPTPEEIWFKGPLRDRIQKGALEAIEMLPTLFDQDAARSIVTRTLDGELPFSASVWRIFCVGRWAQRFSVQF